MLEKYIIYNKKNKIYALIAVKILLVMVHQFVSYSLVQFWALDFFFFCYVYLYPPVYPPVCLFETPSEKFETRTPPEYEFNTD